MDFRSVLRSRVLFLDGGMGTMLQKNGLMPGESPELMNCYHKEAVKSIHRQYIEAGSDIITANTFGAYDFKYESKPNTKAGLEDIIASAVSNAKDAVMESVSVLSGHKKADDIWVAMDMGPTGKLLKPMGELSFHDCLAIFRRTAQLGAGYGADLFILETFSDLYETKAAVIAAKETGLPVLCTMTFDASGHTLTGADPIAMTGLLEGLGVDVIGINCGYGPALMKNVYTTLRTYTSKPILLQPNAGLPVMSNGIAVYSLTPEEYAKDMKEMCEQGAWLLGGCCGTTPEHIERMISLCKDIKPIDIQKSYTITTSYAKAAVLKDGDVIGKLLNTETNPGLADALTKGDMEYAVEEAMEQIDEGAQILEVNVAIDGAGRDEQFLQVIEALQEVIRDPLCIGTNVINVLEKAAQIYNGKPLLRAPDSSRETLEAVSVIALRYGGVVVVPVDRDVEVSGLLHEVQRVVRMLEEQGLKMSDIMIDVSSLSEAGDYKEEELLRAVKCVCDELNIKVLLGERIYG